MVNIIRLLRSYTAGARPPNTHQYGEAYANFADRAFGVMDNSSPNVVPVDFAAPWHGRGTVNKFDNAGFMVWQRTSTLTIAAGTPGFMGDRWLLYPTGAAATVTQSSPGNYRSIINPQITGAGITQLLLRQRMDSFTVADFNNQSFTWQIKAYQSSSATVTPNLSISVASAMNNFTTINLIQNVTLQPMPPSTWTQLSYNFPAQAAQALSNGLSVDLYIPVTLAAGNIVAFAEADIRLCSGLPAGLNSYPPPVELRAFPTELLNCQRFYCQTFDYGQLAGNATTISGALCEWVVATNGAPGQRWQFPVRMRSGQGFTLYTPDTGGANAQWSDGAGHFSANARAFNANTQSVWIDNANITLANAGLWRIHATASAEL